MKPIMVYRFASLILLPGLICASSGFKFLNRPKVVVVAVPLNENYAINCSTNRANVNTELLKQYSGQWVSLPSPHLKRVAVKKDGNVFTILSFGLVDAGSYKCRATDKQTRQKIEWLNPGLFLIADFISLPTLSVVPQGLVILQVGESKSISCHSASSMSLTWYKMLGRNNWIPVPANTIVAKTGPVLKEVILEIKQAKSSDAGSYKCVLRSRGKEKYEMVALTVLSHVFKFVARMPSNAILPVYVNIDPKLTMDCTTTDPSVTPSIYHKNANLFKWRKLDQSEYKKTGNVYTIRISLRSRGHFKCVATNSKGTTIEWPNYSGIFVQPVVLQIPEVTVSPNQTKILTVGESFDFTCSSEVNTNLKWLKIGKDNTELQVPASETLTRMNGNTQELILKIRNSTKDDSGPYKCVLNHAGHLRYKTASLKVYGIQPPNITDIQIKNPVVKLNTKVTIGCIASGYPKPIIKWFKNGKPINDGCVDDFKCVGSKYSIISKSMTITLVKSVLTIHKFNEDDTVYFTCKASNKFGHVKSEVAVTPDIFRFLKPKPRGNRWIQAIPFGKTLTMDCTTSDPKAKTSLLKGMGSLWKPIPKTGKSNVFKIANFSIKDGGTYKCVAYNASGYKIEWPNSGGYFAIADIITLPKMFVSPIWGQQISEGDSLNFTCTSAQNTQLKWFREDTRDKYKPVPGSMTIRYSDAYNNHLVLRFEKAKVSDSGMYKCEMSFRGKESYKLAAVTVHGRKPPRIISHSGQSTPIDIKRGVLLECITEGYPKPSVRWYKDGQQITVPGCQLSLDWYSCDSNKYRIKLYSMHSTKVRSTLKIKHFDKSKNAGVYSCEAFNANGATRANMKVGK